MIVTDKKVKCSNPKDFRHFVFILAVKEVPMNLTEYFALAKTNDDFKTGKNFRAILHC